MAFGTTFVFNNIVFLFALLKKDNSIVDITWGLSLLIPNLVVMFFLSHSYLAARSVLSNALVAVWALRLTYHIGKRHKGVEDYRYAQWREEWERDGKNVAFTSWYFVFLLQALFSCINNLSALYISMYAASKTDPDTAALNALDIIGLLVWLTGFYFEAVGDY